MAKSKDKSGQDGNATADSIKTIKSAKWLRKGSDGELLYGRPFYTWMLIGLGLIVLGFILMAGGHQDPNEWNPDEIYSFRRTTLAPIVILIGLGVEIYAIFKK